jgi:hypothetical protein
MTSGSGRARVPPAYEREWKSFAFEATTFDMPKPSAFRDFMAALKLRWRSDHPFIRPLPEACETLPKASSFYAGVARPSGLYVFLYVQHSSKAWEVGHFTINVILAKDERAPRWDALGRETPDGQLLEGSHRIGIILGGKDKWWRLKPARPGNLSEIVENVTRDVLAALRELEVPEE